MGWKDTNSEEKEQVDKQAAIQKQKDDRRDDAIARDKKKISLSEQNLAEQKKGNKLAADSSKIPLKDCISKNNNDKYSYIETSDCFETCTVNASNFDNCYSAIKTHCKYDESKKEVNNKSSKCKDYNYKILEYKKNEIDAAEKKILNECIENEEGEYYNLEEKKCFNKCTTENNLDYCYDAYKNHCKIRENDNCLLYTSPSPRD